MSGLLALLSRNTGAAIAVALGAFLLLFLGLQLYARATAARPEVTRKLFHTGSGTLTLTFPFLFHAAWPVLVLTGAAAGLVGAVKFAAPLRARFGAVTNRVERTTLGELYFPLAVGWLFWLTRGQDALLFVIPVAMLTFADATGALVGGRYGLTRYVGASKSLEGSVAFIVVAFFCVHVPLLLGGSVGRLETLLISATLALLVMLLEGSAWRGLDNLFIPIGGYFLLRALLAAETAALVSSFAITALLVAVVVVARSRTTLEDDSLVAAAFLCYVAWALAGWRWLVAPVVVLVAYRWLSPGTPDNSRRMHGVPAVLSVWAGALLWLTLARAAKAPALLFPYTLVFGAHLAIFGVSRLAGQFRRKPVGLLLWQAVFASWAIVTPPYLLMVGASSATFMASLLGIAGIALSATVFVALEPRIRDTSQDTRRWLVQGAAATLGSLAGWALVAAAARGLP